MKNSPRPCAGCGTNRERNAETHAPPRPLQPKKLGATMAAASTARADLDRSDAADRCRGCRRQRSCPLSVFLTVGRSAGAEGHILIVRRRYWTRTGLPWLALKPWFVELCIPIDFTVSDGHTSAVSGFVASESCISIQSHDKIVYRMLTSNSSMSDTVQDIGQI